MKEKPVTSSFERETRDLLHASPHRHGSTCHCQGKPVVGTQVGGLVNSTDSTHRISNISPGSLLGLPSVSDVKADCGANLPLI